MYNIRCILLFLLVGLTGLAQDRKIDSLKNALQLRKPKDSVKVEQLFALATAYIISNDANLANKQINEAQRIARHLNNYVLMAKAFEFKAHVSTIIESNYYQALYYKLEELKLIEKSKDSTKMPELMNAIASLYDEIGDLDAAVKYARKSVALSKFSTAQQQALHYNILGYLYLQQKKFDTALPHYQNGLHLARSLKEDSESQYAFALYGIGRIHFKNGHAAIAEASYRESLKLNSKAETGWTEILLMLNYAALAEVFESRRQTDSAIHYYEKSLAFSASQNQKRTETLRELADLYQSRDVVKANTTLRMLVRLNDSIYNRQKLNSIQNLTFNEKLRQQQIAEKNKREAEERRHHCNMRASL